MSRRSETRCRPPVDNEILRRSRLHKNDTYKGEFGTSNKCVIPVQYYFGHNTNFLLEITHKKNRNNKKTTGCFRQSRITNNVSAKTSTKTKYQTSRGQNSFLSSLSFSDLKLSNLNKKDAETEWHTDVLYYFFLNLGRFSSRLRYSRSLCYFQN